VKGEMVEEFELQKGNSDCKVTGSKGWWLFVKDVGCKFIKSSR
jgi:hypothetical protein